MRAPTPALRRVAAGAARRFLGVLNQTLEEAASRHTWLTSYFYAFSSKRFRREQSAVLSGIRLYKGEMAGDRGNIALLRRNIHRLEKGLLMRPRRDLFGLEYLAETVEAYRKRVVEPVADHSDLGLVWAHDVLSSYFEIAPSHDAIDPLREQFYELSPLNGSGDRKLVPFRRNTQQALQVSYESLLRLAEQRCSVRWYMDKKVPRDLIEKALSVAVQAPSACNRQPFEFRFFDDPGLVNQVISVPMGTTGYAENVPVVAVIVGQQRNFLHERDRHLIYIDGALAAMSFALALETLGLASCLINWPDIEEREARMAELLNLELDERPVMLIAFGYPDPEGLVAASTKKDLKTISRFNFE